MMDISDCPRCDGTGMKDPRHSDALCPECDGDGQRTTVTACAECDLPMRVLWSVDHTLAPLRCESCAAVCNETAARVAAGRR